MSEHHLLFAVPVLNRYDLLDNLLVSLNYSSVLPHEAMVIDNGVGRNWFKGFLEYDFHVISPKRNLGVASSWNLALHASKDLLIISNDDVVIGKDTIKNLLEHAESFPTCYLFTTGGIGFSLFLIRRKALFEVGSFDENLWPAYFEDGDYAYRLKLLGHPHIDVPNGGAIHHGSSTNKMKSAADIELHHRQFRANQDYYIAKWGGGPHHEKFLSPFNRDNHG